MERLWLWMFGKEHYSPKRMPNRGGVVEQPRVGTSVWFRHLLKRHLLLFVDMGCWRVEERQGNPCPFTLDENPSHDKQDTRKDKTFAIFTSERLG